MEVGWVGGVITQECKDKPSTSMLPSLHPGVPLADPKFEGLGWAIS